MFPSFEFFSSNSTFLKTLLTSLQAVSYWSKAVWSASASRAFNAGSVKLLPPSRHLIFRFGVAQDPSFGKRFSSGASPSRRSILFYFASKVSTSRRYAAGFPCSVIITGCRFARRSSIIRVACLFKVVTCSVFTSDALVVVEVR